jgi:hypothetical protein
LSRYIMNSIQLKSRVGADGVLKLEVPVEVTETDLDVLVVFQPLAQRPALDKLGWPSGFFETIAGGWQGEPLTRAPQGDYEDRAELR